jgi:hypothetical protein
MRGEEAFDLGVDATSCFPRGLKALDLLSESATPLYEIGLLVSLSGLCLPGHI